MAIINTGLGKAHLLGVRLDDKLKGDVTRSHVEWDLFKRIPPLSSPIYLDGKIYVTSDLGILSRFDAATGEFEGLLSLKARFTASGVSADGLIFYPGEGGETVIVQPGTNMKILATNTLDEGCMASPALDGSSIFLRTRSHVYRIGQ